MVSSSSPSTLTSFDLLVSIEAGDVLCVLSCLCVMYVSNPLHAVQCGEEDTQLKSWQWPSRGLLCWQLY